MPRRLTAGLTSDAIAHRMDARGWQELLPDVFLTHAGEPARRQLLVAALLWAEDDAAIDHRDACHFHGVRSVVPDDRVVHVLVPQRSGKRSTRFVVVRRSTVPTTLVRTQMLRYVDVATAVIAAGLDMGSERAVPCCAYRTARSSAPMLSRWTPAWCTRRTGAVRMRERTCSTTCRLDTTP